ncbi:MAG TPA: PQQ-binding-like beta-propeller repeat protein [Gaiellaceae bacterium]|nr:PQQ-binding-like beta-propeller repeat protein [Gaiellaceae bacterium]
MKELTRAALVIAVVLCGGGGAVAADTTGDWTAFGRTPDNNRHSPLTQISPGNVDRMGRVFTVDLRRVDPDVRRGQQSYPLAIDGTLYVTTNNNFAFGIDGATGKVKWEYRPKNSGLFVNFGVAANRGLAYCAGKLYMTTLDMQLVALRPSNGDVAGKIAISQFVPNASANYGYSQTSAPICARGKLVMGAAGSEYGVRGYVMAFNSDLTPAWPNPYWTIPPEQQQWRSRSRIVGGGVVWTPVTIDARTNTVYFGTGSGTPNFYHDLHPGPNPRANSLIAVDLGTGRQRWWRQLVANDQWNYDVAQPPLVYDAKIGGRTRRVVSVASKEGVWFAFDARSGQALHERVKVIDRVEHPPLRPGQPVTIFPSALGGVNYSPASYDPKTNYVFNAAAETAAVLIQDKLTPTQKRRKLIQGDVFLGLQNGNFGGPLASWHDHGSISAINVATGRRVWKFQTPEPERGGITTTASGLGFAGGGDGVLRAFDVKTGKILWRFQTGAPIASGPTLYLNDGKEYLAITVGGTPTSSNGGVASELQVFAVGGSQQESKPPAALTRAAFAASEAPRVLSTPVAPHAARAPVAGAKGLGARLTTVGPIRVRAWLPSGNNTENAPGRLLLRGKPVSGARISVDRYVLPRATGADGRFTAPIDVTLVRRHLVKVADVSRARVSGRPLNAAERSALRAATGGFTVAYRVNSLKASRGKGGNVVVTGRIATRGGFAPAGVSLFTYRLSGRITNADGKPVSGATVVTRTVDRDFWTFSEPSDADGNYTSFFAASDKSQDDPVPFSVQVALGSVSYTSGLIPTVKFKRLRSARMDVQLPARVGGALPLPTATSYEGAVYQGLLVGVSAGGRVLKPVSAQWPDAKGRFRLVLPPSARGKTVRLWQSNFQGFATFPAKPGGDVDLRTWPAGLSPRVATGTANLKIPR